MTAPHPKPADPVANEETKGGFPWKTTIFLVLAAAAGVYIYYSGAPKQQRGGFGRFSMPTPVTTVAARQGEMKVYLTALGSVAAWNTVTVRSRADGQLLKLHFTEGQHVQEGDLLAEIDPRAYQVGLEQAEGQLARDQALLENARQDFERYQNAQEAVTPQQVDQAKAAVAQYTGIVRTDQGNVDNYKLQLSYCRITAPSSGRTGIRLVDEGNLIHANDATGLVVITQDQPIAVLFSVPEDNLPQVRKALVAGQTLPVDAYDRAMNKVLATGVVIAMDNQIDTATGTVRLKAQFSNDDGALFPNQFVNIRLLIDTIPQATIVPVSAVQINGATRFVFVVGGSGAAARAGGDYAGRRPGGWSGGGGGGWGGNGGGGGNRPGGGGAPSDGGKPERPASAEGDARAGKAAGGDTATPAGGQQSSGPRAAAAGRPGGPGGAAGDQPTTPVEQRTVTVGQTEGDNIQILTGLQPGEIVVTEGLDKLQNGSPVIARLAGAPAPIPGNAPENRRNRKQGDAKDK